MDLRLYNKIVNKIKSNSESKIILYRTIAIVLLFVVTVYMVYIAPIGLDKLFCAALIVMFWYSKSNYFWFAFFIIISCYPAGLFTELAYTSVRRLPIYSPFEKVSFTVMDVFMIVALFKAIIKGKSVKYRDMLKLKNIVYIFPLILLISFFYGFSLKLFFNQAIRGLFFYTLIYSFPSLIHNKRELYKFMLMFFPFVFLELLSQMYTINVGTQLSNLLNPGTISGVYNSVTKDIRAIPDGYITLRLAYVFAFVFLDNKDNLIPKIYPIAVILSVLTSVVISATRSAIIMMLFIFIMYFIFVAKKKPNILLQMFIVIIAVILILDFINVFNLNDILGSSYKRFIGAVSVEDGSLKAEDTFDSRISYRLPLLLETINKSLFIGYGFSDRYFEYYDGHLGGIIVGVLQVGIFGYVLYLVFIVNVFKRCFRYIKKLPENNTFLNPIKVFVVSFFGYAIVNSTVEPIFVLHTSTVPQDILIHFIVASFLIYLALREQAIKKMESKYGTEKIA